MTSERDVWRSAKLLIDQHGSDAPIRAAQRADEMLAAGDIEGRAAWLRILAAVKQLLGRPSRDRLRRRATTAPR